MQLSVPQSTRWSSQTRVNSIAPYKDIDPRLFPTSECTRILASGLSNTLLYKNKHQFNTLRQSIPAQALQLSEVIWGTGRRPWLVVFASKNLRFRQVRAICGQRLRSSFLPGTVRTPRRQLDLVVFLKKVPVVLERMLFLGQIFCIYSFELPIWFPCRRSATCIVVCCVLKGIPP